MFVSVELVTPVMLMSEIGLTISSLLLSSQMISSKVEGGRVFFCFVVTDSLGQYLLSVQYTVYCG